MDCLIKILDLIIKTSIVFGIVLVVISYVRIIYIEKQIEKIRQPFDGEIEKQKDRTLTRETKENSIKDIQERRDIKIGLLERKRERILSKIPFLK